MSPSLRPRVRGESPAFEMKFLLDESRAHDIESRLATRLSFDPHCDRELGNAYRVTSVYCDTAGLEVFHRIGSNRRRKYRVRRYGSDWLQGAKVSPLIDRFVRRDAVPVQFGGTSSEQWGGSSSALYPLLLSKWMEML